MQQGHVTLDCVPYICSSQVAPGGLGECLLHKYSAKIIASLPRGMPCPVFPHSSSLTQGRMAATLRGLPGSAVEIYRVPSPPKLPSHQQEFMPWVQGCLACTIWPRAKHLITRPPSQGFSGWHHHALAFTIEPGECHPGLRITTPLGSCSVCWAPPGSAQALSPGPEPLLPPPCPGAPHLCSLHLDHFPHSCCCYHCNSLVDSKATFTQ